MLWRWIVNALAVAAATALVPGIEVAAGPLSLQLLVIAIAAAVLGAFNAVVKPMAQLLTGCLIILSFGLFLIVINAAMLMVVSWVMEAFGGYWHVDSFWPSAVLGSLVISLVSLMLGVFEPRRPERVVVVQRGPGLRGGGQPRGRIPGHDAYGRPVAGPAPSGRPAPDPRRGGDRPFEGEIYDPEDPYGTGR